MSANLLFLKSSAMVIVVVWLVVGWELSASELTERRVFSTLLLTDQTLRTSQFFGQLRAWSSDCDSIIRKIKKVYMTHIMMCPYNNILIDIEDF